MEDAGDRENDEDRPPDWGEIEIEVEETDFDCVLLALRDAAGCVEGDKEIQAVLDEADRKIREIRAERAGEGKA